MLVTRRSTLSGIKRTRDLDITQEQAEAYEKGAKVQHAFPHLSADDREFIMTGITADEWDATFGEEG
jgi:hypothetical protein